jgi:hypothetical protein
MPELNDRQIAHRQAMLQHLTQIARDRVPTAASFRTTHCRTDRVYPALHRLSARLLTSRERLGRK